jgi:hypothetical protein
LNACSVIGSGSPGTVSDENWQIFGVGDFNGDSKADILWRNASSGQVFEYLMNGLTIIGTGSPGSASNDWQIE